jgi:hypothetical protein
MLPTKIYVRLVVAKMLFRLPKIRQLIKRDFSALLLNFASLKIYKNKSQTQFYALSILICTIPQPELSGALFCAAQPNKKSGNGGRISCPNN